MKRYLVQIANDLGLNPDTLDRWIRQGKIPVNKQGSMCIYNESELNRWAERQRKTSVNHDNKDCIHKEHQNDNISSTSVLFSALKQGGVFHNIVGSSKAEVIASAVDVIPDFPEKNRDEIYHQLMEREMLASTGIGKGVAIPHPRNPLAKGLVDPMIITCFLENSVDFDAIDDKPVLILFLLLSPTIENHLNLLSRLSFCLRDSGFMAFIHQKPNADSLLDRVKEMEADINKKQI